MSRGPTQDQQRAALEMWCCTVTPKAALQTSVEQKQRRFWKLPPREVEARVLAVQDKARRALA